MVTFRTGSAAMARRALDALQDPCAVLRPVRNGRGAIVDFCWVDANTAALDHSGLSYDDFIGLGMTALVPSGEIHELFVDYVDAVEHGTSVDRLDVEFVSRGHLAAARFDLHAVPIDDDLFVSWHDSSARHAHADALATSERRFRILAEHASDVVLETDIEGHIVWVSPTALDVLGIDPFGWIGQRPRDLVVDADTERMAEMACAVLREGTSPPAIECRVVSSSGEVRWMSARARQIREHGDVSGAVLGLRDVQDRVLLRRAVTTLRAANAILVRAEREQDLLEAMCEVATKQAGYVFAWYARPVHDDGRSVVPVASTAAHRDYLNDVQISWADTPLGQGPTGACLRTGLPHVVNDSVAEATFLPWLLPASARGFRSTLSLPVFVNGELDGAYNLYAAEPDAFDEQAVAVMEEVAAQLGYGIARLRDAERLKHSLDAQRLLSAAIDQAAEAIVVTDAGGLMRYANPAALRNSGFTIDEVIGRNPRMFQSGLHDQRFYEDLWKPLMGGKPWHGVIVNRRKSGEFYEEQVTIAPVHDEAGERIAFVAVKHDLTRERSLEAVLSREQTDRDTIVQVMRDVRAGDSLEATAASLCEAVQRFDDIAGAMVVMLLADGSAVPIALSGAPMPTPSEVGTPFDFDKLAQMVEFSTAGPWWIDFREADGLAALDPDFTRSMLGVGFTASAYAPIRWEGQVIGVVAVATKSASVHEWMPTRIAVLTEVGTFAGMLLGPQAAQHGERERIRTEILDLIEHERFHAVFEPVIHLPSGSIVGYEALTRFDGADHPERRFAAAHAVGLGTDLEAACARVALREAAQLPASAWLSVNFSPASIVEGCAADVLRNAPRQVIIEITEHNAIENYAAVRRGIQQCGEVLVAVDDAGAGFASLRHILELQPDIIKLDIALVRDIHIDPARQALAAGLRHFAALTGTTLVAEGIETEAEAKAIRQLGVELAQGYHFGPQP